MVLVVTAAADAVAVAVAVAAAGAVVVVAVVVLLLLLVALPKEPSHKNRSIPQDTQQYNAKPKPSSLKFRVRLVRHS